MPRGLIKKNPDLAQIVEVIDSAKTASFIEADVELPVASKSPKKHPNSRTSKPASKASARSKTKKSKAKLAPRQKTLRSLGRAVLPLAENDSRTQLSTQLPAQPSVSDTQPSISVDFNSNAITNCQELLSAIAAGVSQVALADNIIVTDNILITHDLTIDFNGFSIISEETHASMRVLDVRSGQVILTGQGKIFAMGKNSVAIRAFGAISSGIPNYTTIMIGEGISLFAPDSYGILISPNLGVAYGLKINFSGKIFAHDGICLPSGIRGYDLAMPEIVINDHSEIIADELAGSALEATGYGKWIISSAHLRGAIGASLSSGILSFDHAQVISSRGECFRLLENIDALLDVKVNGGSYVSYGASVIAGTSGPIKKFEVKNCNFCATTDMIAKPLLETIKTKKINFHTDVQAFLANLAPVAESLPNQPTDAAAASPINSTEAMDAIADDFDESTIDWIDDESIEDLESEFEDLLDLEEKPKKKSKKLLRSKTKTKTPKAKNRKKPTANDFPELTDDATDEQEILSTLAAEGNFVEPKATIHQDITAMSKTHRQSKSAKTDPIIEKPLLPSPAPLLTPPPEPALPVFTSEQDAARRALFDAITDIRKLSAEDYDTGFTELEQAIQQAERLLRNPLADLSDICDAASTLLRAFDDLEERDDASLMSDEELDELFYHGAVLQEMLKESKKDKPTHHKKHAKVHAFLPESPKSAFAGVPDLLEVVEKRKSTHGPAQNFPQPQVASELNPNFVPNFAELSAVLTRISELDLNSYTLSSQETLLKTLSDAQTVLNDPSASQFSIDNLATKLSTEITQLVPLRQPYNNTAIYQAELNAPAPTLGNLPVPTMIDELTPTSVWSLGVTMIDELTPFTTDPTTREKMLRAMQSQFYVLKKSLTKPFAKLAKSFAAGLRAGVHAYKETLHAVQN